MQQTAFFSLQGGLDLVTPAIQTPSGRMIAGYNYEPGPRGYKRVDGYERYDGRPEPQNATYYLLNFDAGTAAITEGQTVTGATSGATGKALIDAVVSSGSYGGGNAAGYLILDLVTGTFQDNENLQVSAVTKSVANGVAIERGAATDALDTTYYRDAIETRRALIAAPTGSGPIRGVWVFNGTAYCFRNNAGGTAGLMYKATSTGWSAVSLGVKLAFTGGTSSTVADGQTLVGASSGATGVVTRQAIRTGTVAASTAAGIFTFASVTGTFTNGENLQVGGVTKAVASGTQAAITLPAGGHYEFVNHNFFGASNLARMYGVNGVGTAFDFDGTTFVPIATSMTTDTPKHIAVHKQHLFLAFPGGSAQHSGTGDPYAWTPVTGAAELGIGEEITGFIQDFAKQLVILGRNKIAVLYGNDSSDWVLVPIADDAGAIEWTAQRIGNPIYVDDRGIRDMRATPAFGDFNMGAVSQLIEPLFRTKKVAGITPTASVRVRAKDQYRFFWSDDTGVTVYLGRKNPECTFFKFSHSIECACSSEDSSGNEIMLFGSDNGMVYRLDAGTSFDGGTVEAFIRLPFNHVGSPTQNKRWHKATLEGNFSAAVSLGMLAEFSYGDPGTPPAIEQTFSVQGGGDFWNELTLNDFYWSAPVEGVAECSVDGLGRNISIAVVSSSIYEPPHQLHGLTLHYSYRGLAR